MKVSIIIPCRNAANTLDDCLSAVFKLHGSEEIEVLLVDDASTDDSIRIAAKYPCRIIPLTRHGGPGRARNKGVEASSGELIFFTDTDVVLPENSVDLARAALEQSPGIGCVVGVFSEQNPDNGFFSQYKSLYSHYKYKHLAGGTPFNTAVAAVPKRFFLELDGFDETLSAVEDGDFGERLHKKGFASRIEHRLEVLHLKKFGPISLLVNDFKKSLGFAEIFFMRMKKGNLIISKRFIDIPLSSILDVPIVYLCSASLLGLLFGSTNCALILFLSTAAYLANNFRFFNFLYKKKGLRFSALSGAFTFLDYIVVGWAVLLGANILWRHSTKEAFLKEPLIIQET